MLTREDFEVEIKKQNGVVITFKAVQKGTGGEVYNTGQVFATEEETEEEINEKIENEIKTAISIYNNPVMRDLVFGKKKD